MKTLHPIYFFEEFSKFLEFIYQLAYYERYFQWKSDYTQKQPLEVFCKKKVFSEISQSSHESTTARASSLQLYWKRESGTGVFLWILLNFEEHLFDGTPQDDCFCVQAYVDSYCFFLICSTKLIIYGNKTSCRSFNIL